MARRENRSKFHLILSHSNLAVYRPGFFHWEGISKEFLSPSEAAVTITRSSVDSWLFWDCKPPGASSWIDIYTLKQMK